MGAVTFDGLAFHGRRRPRHDDVGLAARRPSRQGQGLGVVARRVGHEGRVLGRLESCICGPSYFKRARSLKDLALELQGAPGELVETIDWTPFFQTWELAGSYPKILDDDVVGTQARELFADAQKMLDRIVREKLLTARAVVGLLPANRSGDDIHVWTDEARTERRAVLHTLRQRYERGRIYTAVGPIILAVNPFCATAECAPERLACFTLDADPAGLPPHVFHVARSAYTVMAATGGAQSVLISGESGAGKTETAKLCMACLAQLSQSPRASTEAALESSLLLEAFGNAKTVYNENSSRFGKWVEVHFCRTRGALRLSRIS